MLPFSYPRESLAGFSALEAFDFTREELRQHRGKRNIAGDHLGGVVDRGYADQPRLYPAFASLFQGDHLGVEFALASHEKLLQDEGLLPTDQRILGHSPFPPSPSWQALVIDDFFCLSAEKRSLPATSTYAFKALAWARDAYDRHRLEGSVAKDVVSSRRFKAAGAEIDSSEAVVDLGLVTVAAPLSKRIGLSTLSLRAARLRWISNKLASRLAGNWISVILYRRCWSSLVEKFFALSAECERHFSNAIIPLPRDCAEELVSLAAVVPLIASDITASFSSQVYASDASMKSGAAVCTEVPQDL